MLSSEEATSRELGRPATRGWGGDITARGPSPDPRDLPRAVSVFLGARTASCQVLPPSDVRKVFGSEISKRRCGLPATESLPLLDTFYREYPKLAVASHFLRDLIVRPDFKSLAPGLGAFDSRKHPDRRGELLLPSPNGDMLRSQEVGRPCRVTITAPVRRDHQHEVAIRHVLQ